MAQLYFKYGAMGSSKTANALMARFNYEERGQETLLVKPQLDQRDGDHIVRSRIGLTNPCIYFHEMLAMPDAELQQYACIIVDEAQFLTKDEVRYLVHLVDDCGIPVMCYGLRADFKGDLFEGSRELLIMADKLEEVKTICWCGKCWGLMTSISACAAATGWPMIWGRISICTALEIDSKRPGTQRFRGACCIHCVWPALTGQSPQRWG